MSIMTHSNPVWPNYTILIICGGKNEVSHHLKERLSASKQMSENPATWTEWGRWYERVWLQLVCGVLTNALVKCEMHPSLCFPNSSAYSAALVVNERLPKMTWCPQVDLIAHSESGRKEEQWPGEGITQAWVLQKTQRPNRACCPEEVLKKAEMKVDERDLESKGRSGSSTLNVRACILNRNIHKTTIEFTCNHSCGCWCFKEGRHIFGPSMQFGQICSLFLFNKTSNSTFY